MVYFAAIPRTANEVFEPLKKGKAISLNDKEGYQMFHSDLEQTESVCNVHNDAHLLNDVDQITSLVATRMPKAQKEFSKYATLCSKASDTSKTFIAPKVFILRNLDWFCLKAHKLPLIHAKIHGTGPSGWFST